MPKSKAPKVSIIIPVIRPESAKRCIEAIKKNAGIAPNLYEILAIEDTDGIGCPKMVKELTEMSRADLVLFLGDDTEPQEGFLRHALNAMAEIGWGVVGLNTQGVENDHGHWLASKKMLEHIPGKAFFSTEYRHCWCDDELKEIALELGRWAYCKEAYILHHHPICNGSEWDAGYQRAYAEETKKHDRKTYFRRRVERIKARYGMRLGIGWPLTDDKDYRQFMVSFTAMEKPDFTLLTPQFKADIGIVRNSLVYQAMQDGCTHLIMMDTDQIYPPDTITKLLAHNLDAVGALVHRRYPPFDPIMYRGSLGKYIHVPDEECFSGKLVEVAATGCGCILYDMRVFGLVEEPWFKLDRGPDGKAIGEDIGMCDKLIRAGCKIYVDTSIAVDHLCTFRVNRATYELFKKTTNLEWRAQDEIDAA